ncbi:MAG: cob(I)yrinic acid a,c-diamide adenosyltransferase [Bacteroidetes bacterium]|nr:MAG: cob(I)yrinic acid a,c-diamide adenosyltransferase [Bacteroidota bacterium]
MKIYTKTGDEGETGLFGGQRVAKDDRRLAAYGTLDELNAFVGLLRDGQSEEAVRDTLFQIQNRLFSLGAYLATPAKAAAPAPVPDVTDTDILLLEQEMDRMDTALEPLRNFILPGGHPLVSYAHLARTVCRRAERSCVSLHRDSPLHPLLLQYLNRLSDYFFMLARYSAKSLGVEEVAWKGRE